jgi:uncharacterized protein
VIIVSDTSPIINLAAVGQLELLHHLYGTISIPHAVYHEVAIRGHEQAGAIEVQTWSWFKRHQVRDAALVRHLKLLLDVGEAEAIALAIEIHADLLLLDERRGRAIAKELGLAVMGLIGVLLVAKQQGYLAAIKSVLDSLITEAGFWIDERLYTLVLESSGEL